MPYSAFKRHVDHVLLTRSPCSQALFWLTALLWSSAFCGSAWNLILNPDWQSDLKLWSTFTRRSVAYMDDYIEPPRPSPCYRCFVSRPRPSCIFMHVFLCFFLSLFFCCKSVHTLISWIVLRKPFMRILSPALFVADDSMLMRFVI